MPRRHLLPKRELHDDRSGERKGTWNVGTVPATGDILLVRRPYLFVNLVVIVEQGAAGSTYPLLLPSRSR